MLRKALLILAGKKGLKTKIHLAFSYIACYGVWDRYKSKQDTTNFRLYPFRTTRIREYEEVDEHVQNWSTEIL